MLALFRFITLRTNIWSNNHHEFSMSPRSRWLPSRNIVCSLRGLRPKMNKAVLVTHGYSSWLIWQKRLPAPSFTTCILSADAPVAYPPSPTSLLPSNPLHNAPGITLGAGSVLKHNILVASHSVWKSLIILLLLFCGKPTLMVSISILPSIIRFRKRGFPTFLFSV